MTDSNIFSNFINGNNNYNIIENKDGHIVLYLDSKLKNNSINLITNFNDNIENRFQLLSDGSLNLKSNIILDNNYSFNGLKFNYLESFGNTSNGTLIKAPYNKSIYFSIEGDDIQDSFNILKNNNNGYKNMFSVNHNGIGILNDTPVAELDVNGTIKTKKIIVENSENSNIKFKNNNDVKISIDLKNENLNFNNQQNILSIKHDGFLMGNIGIGTEEPYCKLDINSNSIRIRDKSNIPTENTIGNIGEIRWNENFIFICVNIINNKFIWKKAELK